nr:immunoglobulin heavy chain junction region [Macaca mulatta]MOW99137.1 immunoglobulin heavy chain junction region [Macaca mulatta]MOW99420.1 immunoglobulin heavy chain junction region [Macaca mulatta]MOW99458.1 immunoglobulin heavy chain junction region [Macaca mulatta]MOX02609.1 immunoglobulin heavy chain junction region [Macaca mulatta]
CAADKWFAVW